MLKKFGSIWVLCLLLVICSVTACNNGQVQPPESGKDGVSIVWKGSFASADEIENPQYLWAYYNTTDGCSYIYDGEKWTLLAGKAPETGAGAGTDTPVLDGFIPEATEVFIVTYQTDYATAPQQFYCMKGYKIPTEKLPQLTETHHDFGGWYDGETSVSNGYVIQKNTTLKAKWSLKKYTITYVCDEITPPDPVVVEYGTTLDVTYFPDLTNAQYRFFYWKENESKVGLGYVVDHNATFKAFCVDINETITITLSKYVNENFNREYIVSDVANGSNLYEALNCSTEEEFIDIIRSNIKVSEYESILNLYEEDIGIISIERIEQYRFYKDVVIEVKTLFDEHDYSIDIPWGKIVRQEDNTITSKISKYVNPYRPCNEYICVKAGWVKNNEEPYFEYVSNWYCQEYDDFDVCYYYFNEPPGVYKFFFLLDYIDIEEDQGCHFIMPVNFNNDAERAVFYISDELQLNYNNIPEDYYITVTVPETDQW